MRADGATEPAKAAQDADIAGSAAHLGTTGVGVSPRVQELCRAELLSFSPNIRARSALDQLCRAHLHAAPVVLDNGRAVGVIAKGDLTGELGSAYVADRMSTPTVAIAADATVREAAELAAAHALHHLVVTERGVTVGFLSALDLLRALLDAPRSAEAPPR